MRHMRRMGLVLLALLVAAAFAATAAQACNTGWSRTPDDGNHYFAGLLGSPFITMDGVNANIYVTDPTNTASAWGDAFAFTSAWVGMNGLTTSGGLILAQEGMVKSHGFGNVDCTIYEINGTSWAHECGQNLSVGATNNWNVYYQESDGTMHFDFSGVEKWNVVVSSLGVTLASNPAWFPEASAENGSYKEQLPGTSGNVELFSQLEIRRTSNHVWDLASADAGWATQRLGIHTPGHPNLVSQTNINNSFGATFSSGSPGSGTEWDKCTAS